MPETLKDSFGIDVARRIAAQVGAVDAGFDRRGFVAACRRGFDGLELMARGEHIAHALGRFLPEDRGAALRTLVASLPPATPRMTGMAGFFYLPHVRFVALYGLDHFEAAMDAQRELTRRFTAEFSLRAFLERHPERTVERLTLWCDDLDEHVRRLVSEGTRPRLPWAPRLRVFEADPRPVLALLERLRDDPSEYVRRSVANHLNDLAKDDPERILALARRWLRGAPARRPLVAHALRTLLKRGDARALALLGYTEPGAAEVTVTRLELAPERPRSLLKNPGGLRYGRRGA